LFKKEEVSIKEDKGRNVESICMVKILKLFLDSLKMNFEDSTSKSHQKYNFYL